MNRRSFFKKILSIVFSLELILLIFGGIGKIRNVKRKDTLFKAGKVSNFVSGQTYLFLSGQFFLCRYNDGGFMAMSIKCTHLACAITKNAEGFVCPCHSSKFNKKGEAVSAPATRPLDIFEIIVENNEILVNTSKPIKRLKFEKSQLTYC